MDGQQGLIEPIDTGVAASKGGGEHRKLIIVDVNWSDGVVRYRPYRFDFLRMRRLSPAEVVDYLVACLEQPGIARENLFEAIKDLGADEAALRDLEFLLQDFEAGGKERIAPKTRLQIEIDVGPSPAKHRQSPKRWLTPVARRQIDAAAQDKAQDDLLFQHTVLCQTCLPYRDPGEGVRTWKRTNGRVGLQVEAGGAWHRGDFVELGLPFGAKPRLVLMHLNAEAVRTGSPIIEVEGSLSAFVRRLKLDTGGRNKHVVKDQLARLSASSIRLGMVKDGRAITVNTQVVTAFDLWFVKDERQRVLWPTSVRLSAEYFESLQEHAVPLDENAIRALAHNAMGLDIYGWLAQRLHRIDPGKPQLVPWAALKEQFGWHYDRVRDFRRV